MSGFRSRYLERALVEVQQPILEQGRGMWVGLKIAHAGLAFIGRLQDYRMMEERQALNALGALGQETRLRIVRLLVQASPEGIAAGALAEAVGASASTASFHLAHLERAGLIASRREARSINYSASIPGLTDLIGFLMKDCCGGRPEVCGPVLADLSCLCRDATTPVETSHA